MQHSTKAREWQYNMMLQNMESLPPPNELLLIEGSSARNLRAARRRATQNARCWLLGAPWIGAPHGQLPLSQHGPANAPPSLPACVASLLKEKSVRCAKPTISCRGRTPGDAASSLTRKKRERCAR